MTIWTVYLHGYIRFMQHGTTGGARLVDACQWDEELSIIILENKSLTPKVQWKLNLWE